MKALMQNKKGFALVTALLIMFALSVIGIVAVNSSIVENWMTTNTKVSKQAFFLAEAGAQEAKELLRQRIMDQGSSLTDQINLVKGGDGLLGTADDLSFVSKTLGAGNYSVKLTDDSGQTALGIITLTSTGSGPMNSKATVKQGVQAVNNPPTTETRTIRYPAFDLGIVTERNLIINGGGNINGGTHSNMDTTVNGTSIINGSVSAVGTVTTVGRVEVTGGVRHHVPRIDVPDITSTKMLQLRAAAETTTSYIDGNYTLNTSGDLGNRVIFVNGSLTLNGNVFNGTIVATGNVTINGSSQINNGILDTAIISLGNIVMNGTTDCYGAFWSHGSFVQNGSSRVIGSIVSLGDITRNGDFHFTQRGGIRNDYLPTVTTTVTIPGTITYRVLGWKQG